MRMTRHTSGLLRLATLAILCASPPAGPGAAGGAEPRLFGGIELGAKGIKVVAISVDESGKADPSKLVTKLPHLAVNNVTLVDRLPDGSFRPEAIDEARAAVADYYRHLTGVMKIPPDRIWVVASSGLLQKGLPKNFDVLAKAVNEATGGSKTLQRIDQQTEVDLLIRGAVPRADWGNSILIDIGSGNVKCGYHHPRRGLHVARNYVVPTPLEGTIEYTKTIHERMARDDLRGFGAFCIVATRLRQAAVMDKVAAATNSMPGLEHRSKVFISGGSPWAIATLINPLGAIKVDEPLIPVSVDAIRKFRDELRSTGRIPRGDLAGQPEEVRLRAEEQAREVLDTFTAENIMAGIEILLGFADVLKWEDNKKEVYFTRSGVFAWIMGYVNDAR